MEYVSHLSTQARRFFSTREGENIEKPESVRDLGMFMSNDGTFTKQIQEAVTKANRQTGWIFRTFRTRNPECMLTLFKSTVLPLLEYCSQLWCPSKLGDIRKLEAVQRSFTHRVNGLNNLSYWQRLKSLNLYSLERRRERYTILYLYKIVLGIAPNFTSPRWSIKTRENPRRGLNCVIPSISRSATHRVKSMVEQSFAVRGPRLFNSIPANLRNGNLSYSSFKRQLDVYLNVVPDEPLLPNYPHRHASNSLVARRGAWDGE